MSRLKNILPPTLPSHSIRLGRVALISALGCAVLAPSRAFAQAAGIPSAAPETSAQTGGQDTAQRGRILIDQMIRALGGDAWLERSSVETEGRSATFFHGQPNPGIDYSNDLRRCATASQPEALRQNLLSDRGMILPGKVVGVIHIFKDNKGYEITYKGTTELPKDQVEDFYRRRAHSVDEVVRNWIHAPDVMILADGTSMVGRRLADKVTVLTANNDAVTLELDSTTHLPLRRTFQWRNPQFKDFDEDAEEYDDYHLVQGLSTAMTITRYHNGDMASQRFLTKVTYNAPIAPTAFDQTVPLSKNKAQSKN